MDFTIDTPLPNPTPLTEPFWQGLNEHKILLQHCNACDGWTFYPRSHCSHCLSTDWTWREVSGAGAIYTYTIARRPTAPQFRGSEPQMMAVVELDEGVRLNTLIVSAEENELHVGQRVTPVFIAQPSSPKDQTDSEKHTLLYFKPDS